MVNCVKTECNHYFCRVCIDNHLSNRSRKCPTCATRITKKGCHGDPLIECISFIMKSNNPKEKQEEEVTSLKVPSTAKSTRRPSAQARAVLVGSPDSRKNDPEPVKSRSTSQSKSTTKSIAKNEKIASNQMKKRSETLRARTRSQARGEETPRTSHVEDEYQEDLGGIDSSDSDELEKAHLERQSSKLSRALFTGSPSEDDATFLVTGTENNEIYFQWTQD